MMSADYLYFDEGGNGDGNTERFISEQGLAHGQDGRKQLQLLSGRYCERQVRYREICNADDGGVLLREDPVGGGGEPAITILQIYR